MKYQIKITRKEANPNYEAEVQKYEEENRYGARMMRDVAYPSAEVITNTLLAELTEEEYNQIKSQVFNNWK